MIKRRLDRENRKVFLDGLRRYREQGIQILIDGKEADEGEWEKILEEQDDGSFYMGDYILEEAGSAGSAGLVREPAGAYGDDLSGVYGGKAAGGRRRLKEIRFDRVYNR